MTDAHARRLAEDALANVGGALDVLDSGDPVGDVRDAELLVLRLSQAAGLAESLVRHHHWTEEDEA